MQNSLRLKLEPLKSLAFGSIGADYMGIGTSIENPARLIILQNFTDADLLFSIDAIEDHFILKSYSSLTLDVTTNKTLEEGFFFEKGTRFYVKESGTPTVGTVYVTSIYGEKC